MLGRVKRVNAVWKEEWKMGRKIQKEKGIRKWKMDALRSLADVGSLHRVAGTGAFFVERLPQSDTQ